MDERQYLQWRAQMGDEKYSIFNPDPSTGQKRFYEIVSGQYGQPIIVAEPDFAFSCPEMLNYVNAKGETTVPAEKIAGIICNDGKRFSLTNAKAKNITVEAQDDGSIKINDEIWWIVTLFQKDKNRIINYDAYLSKDRPEKVKILELADLADFLCS